MGDIVIVAPDKETAQEWLAKIKAYLAERLHLEVDQKIRILYTRQGVNTYDFRIKGTHLLPRTETKRVVKRRTRKMMEKMRVGEITRKEVEQVVYSWFGFVRWANVYTLCKKVFAPYRFTKAEGEMFYGAISRPCKARRSLQKRHNLTRTHKTVET